MAETVKTAKALAETTTKPAAEKKAPAVKKTPAAKSRKATAPTNKIHLMPATHEQIAALAHKYWAERGQDNGHHEDDWYRAEQELRGKAS